MLTKNQNIIVVGSLLYNLSFLVAIVAILSCVGTNGMFSASSDRIITCSVVLSFLLTVFTIAATFLMFEVLNQKPLLSPNYNINNCPSSAAFPKFQSSSSSS